MRVLSGIQPSGKLHIGNYFGAIRQHIALQAENTCFYFIANYHALTTTPDLEQLRRFTLDVALDFLACGLDPERAVFFRQSDVPEVCELTWQLRGQAEGRRRSCPARRWRRGWRSWTPPAWIRTAAVFIASALPKATSSTWSTPTSIWSSIASAGASTRLRWRTPTLG